MNELADTKLQVKYPIEYSIDKLNEVVVTLEIPFNNEELYPEVYFTVDTGATISTLTLEVLNQLDYSVNWVIENTVNIQNITLADGGTIESHKIIFPKIKVFGQELENQEFCVFINAKKDENNLLGMNILSNFDFSFIFSERTFKVSHAKQSETKATKGTSNIKPTKQQLEASLIRNIIESEQN